MLLLPCLFSHPYIVFLYFKPTSSPPAGLCAPSHQLPRHTHIHICSLLLSAPVCQPAFHSHSLTDCSLSFISWFSSHGFPCLSAYVFTWMDLSSSLPFVPKLCEMTMCHSSHPAAMPTVSDIGTHLTQCIILLLLWFSLQSLSFPIYLIVFYVLHVFCNGYCKIGIIKVSFSLSIHSPTHPTKKYLKRIKHDTETNSLFCDFKAKDMSPVLVLWTHWEFLEMSRKSHAHHLPWIPRVTN